MIPVIIDGRGPAQPADAPPEIGDFVSWVRGRNDRSFQSRLWDTTPLFTFDLAAFELYAEDVEKNDIRWGLRLGHYRLGRSVAYVERQRRMLKAARAYLESCGPLTLPVVHPLAPIPPAVLPLIAVIDAVENAAEIPAAWARRRWHQSGSPVAQLELRHQTDLLHGKWERWVRVDGTGIRVGKASRDSDDNRLAHLYEFGIGETDAAAAKLREPIVRNDGGEGASAAPAAPEST